METYSALLAICVSKWRGALMFSLICVWINGWVNNGEAGDLRRYRAHYGVIVMIRMDIHITSRRHYPTETEGQDSVKMTFY